MQLALDCLNSAVEADPSRSRAYDLRGQLYYLMREATKSIADFTRFIEREPERFTGYFRRGLAYLRATEYRKAIQDFDRTIDLQPHHALAFKWRAEAYFQLGLYQNCIDDFGRSLSLDSSQYRVHVMRSRARLLMVDGLESNKEKRNQLTQSLKELDEAVGLNDKESMCYYIRALTRFGLAQLDEESRREYLESATDDLQKAISLDPGDSKNRQSMDFLSERIEELLQSEGDP